MKRPLTTLTAAGALTLATTFAAPSWAAEDEYVEEEEPTSEYDDDEMADKFRLRGGFLFGGGLFSIPEANKATGGAASLGVQLGAQFNHYFSIYYQVTPLIGLIASDDFSYGLFIYNSFLAGLTLLDFLDIGFGPSVDVYTTGTGSIAKGGGGSEAGAAFGLHLKGALIIGSGPTKDEARRSGFTLGVDFHPFWLRGTTGLSLTFGIGGTWY